MKLYAAVVNTYGKVGQEFVDFCAVVDSSSRGKGRGRNLTNLLSLLGVYANAEQVLLTHAPSMKRAQRGDVKAAIAAKEAQEAAAATAKAAKVAQAAAAAQLKVPSKVRKGLDIRGDTYMDGKVKKVFDRIPRVEQPLRELIPNDIWEKVLSIIEGRSEMDSILKNYYDGQRDNGHS